MFITTLIFFDSVKGFLNNRMKILKCMKGKFLTNCMNLFMFFFLG